MGKLKFKVQMKSKEAGKPPTSTYTFGLGPNCGFNMALFHNYNRHPIYANYSFVSLCNRMSKGVIQGYNKMVHRIT